MSGKKGGGIEHHAKDCVCPPCRWQAKTLALTARGSAADHAPVEPLAKGPGVEPVDPDIFVADGRTPRDRVGAWLLLRQREPGITNQEVAKRLGIAYSTLQANLSRARREGWLVFSDPLTRIEHEIIPQTLDNIAFYLSKEGGRDKQITLETAKATIYRQFIESKGISDAPQTVLALKIETMEGAETKVVSGTIVGKARVIELKDQNES